MYHSFLGVRGVIKHTWAFGAAAIFSVLSTVCVLMGAAIYTAIISKAKTVNDFKVCTSLPLATIVQLKFLTPLIISS